MDIFSRLGFSLTVLCLLLFSCSGDESKTDEIIEPSCKIVSLNSNWYMDDMSGTPSTSGFAFDGQGRIILAPTGSRQISFEYYNDKIILKYSNEAPNTVTDYYTLNDKKQIIHLVRKAMNTYWGDTELKDYMVLDYLYDDAGYLTAIKEGSNQTTFTYADGNLINIKDALNNQDRNYTFSYDKKEPYYALPLAELTPIYHMESLHRLPTPSNNPDGMSVLTIGGYFGKLPKNQIKSIDSYKFSYTKNDNKQIIKLKVVNEEEAIDSMIYKFDYMCK